MVLFIHQFLLEIEQNKNDPNIVQKNIENLAEFLFKIVSISEQQIEEITNFNDPKEIYDYIKQFSENPNKGNFLKNICVFIRSIAFSIASSDMEHTRAISENLLDIIYHESIKEIMLLNGVKDVREYFNKKIIQNPNKENTFNNIHLFIALIGTHFLNHPGKTLEETKEISYKIFKNLADISIDSIIEIMILPENDINNYCKKLINKNSDNIL